MSYSQTGESLPPENHPYHFCIQHMPRLVHLSFIRNYWNILHSCWKTSEGALGKHCKRDVFSITKNLVLISLFYWLNDEYSAQTCNLYVKRVKMQIKCWVEMPGTDLKLISPEVTLILTKMHSTVFVINISITCFVRCWKEMKKQILCNLQTTWQQIGILYFFVWMMGRSLEKVWLVMIPENEQGTLAKIQGSMLKKHWALSLSPIRS